MKSQEEINASKEPGGNLNLRMNINAWHKIQNRAIEYDKIY